MLKIRTIKLAQDHRDEIPYDFFGNEEHQNRIVNEDNLRDYLVDDVEGIPGQEQLPPPMKPQRPDWMEEMPSMEESMVGIPEDSQELEYDNPDELIDDGIRYQRIIKFDYVNRHGTPTGERIVEPHYKFHAYSTGNTVLVSFDLSVGDIRAFIIDPVNMPFGGALYDKAGFTPRNEIMVGS